MLRSLDKELEEERERESAAVRGHATRDGERQVKLGGEDVERAVERLGADRLACRSLDVNSVHKNRK
jgi:hypothetical protein